MTNGEKIGYKRKPNCRHDNRISLIAELKKLPGLGPGSP
jgi:hypothetical protein